MTVSIRRAVADDLEELRLLLRETWHATYDELYGTEEVERLTSDWHSIEAMEQRLLRPDGLFLIAEDDGRTAGMAFAVEEQPEIIFLHQLYVRPGDQGKGVGSNLLRDVEAGFAGTRCIRADVEVANRGAIGFYEHHGFVSVGLEAETASPKMMRMERRLDGRGRDGQSRAGTP